MRHRKAGKKLDRRDQERVALYRNLTISLIERFGTPKEYILTSVAKAKAVRPFAERIITLAIKARKELEAAAKAGGTSVEGLHEAHTKGEGGRRKKFAPRQKPAGKVRPSKKGVVPKVHPPTPASDLFPVEGREHAARSLHIRRIALARLRYEPAVKALIERVAVRYLDRPGGYLRILKTSLWVKGDGSTKAMIGWVGGAKPGGAAPVRTESKVTVAAK